MKSYFYGDARKKIEDLLGEVATVEGLRCDGELEALVLEARLIGRHEPKYNRRGKTWRRSAYLKLDPSEAFPRLKVVYASKPADGCLYLGPFGTSARARLAKEALEEVVPIRRCTQTMRAATRFAPCALADMGRCPAPCDGRIDPERYGELVGRLVSSLTASPGELLGALESRMSRLADQGRYEEAALVRDRLRALAEALARRRQDAWLVGADDLRLTTQEGLALSVPPGRLDPRTGNAPRPPLSRSPARVSAPTSSRPCGRGSTAQPPRISGGSGPWPSEPVDGGAAVARILARARAADLPPLRSRRDRRPR